MKKTLQILVLLLVNFQVNYAQRWEVRPNHQYDAYFAEAYANYPTIPRGLLEAIAYTNTHLRHIQPEEEHPSCVGLPHYYGVMGLVENGQGYFNNNLQNIASLSGYSIADIKND